MKYFYLLFLILYLYISDARGNNYYGYYPNEGFMGYILGGVEVPIAMYPYVATLTINSVALCGGSIISDRVILTAAHCTFDREIKRYLKPDAFDVRLGSSFIDEGTLYRVCKVVPHELYSPRRYFYDIAVLMLDRRIKFGSLVRKVKIAPDNSWRKEKYSFTIAGFGMVSHASGASTKLRATRMSFVDSATCNQSQSFKPMIVPNHMFCMIGQRWTSDCFGDSGSGVMWRGYLVGIVATGRDNFCGADMMPSMYTDVTFFRKWIKTKIKEANALSIRKCYKSKNKYKLRAACPFRAHKKRVSYSLEAEQLTDIQLYVETRQKQEMKI